MPSMVTGDQTTSGDDREHVTEDEPHLSGPKQCSCEWRTIDGGAVFHSTRVKPDPKCPVHRGI